MCSTDVVSHVKVLFPSDLNDNETLFGGMAMQWMDQVAYVAATRYTRKKMVTVSVGKVRFLKPVTAGQILEIKAKVVDVTAATLVVGVDIYCEHPYVGDQVKAIDATITFAAVDEQGNPVRIR